MSEAMKQLREEHQGVAELLDALEHQISVSDTMERPDYDVLTALAEYFVVFYDRCHRAKEILIYRKMHERNPTLAQMMTDLEAEQEEISTLARHFQKAVQNVLQDAEISRSAFDEVVLHFVRDQRRYMKMEEERFFPLAQQILTPDDWVEIDERIAREDDPVFGVDVSQESATLRDKILKWEAEDEALEDRTQ
jgi:hemerythrin-like domain-containing protein